MILNLKTQSTWKNTLKYAKTSIKETLKQSFVKNIKLWTDKYVFLILMGVSAFLGLFCLKTMRFDGFLLFLMLFLVALLAQTMYGNMSALEGILYKYKFQDDNIPESYAKHLKVQQRRGGIKVLKGGKDG